MLPITNSEIMHFYRDNDVFEIVTNKFIQSNIKQLFDIKVFYQTWGELIVNANALIMHSFSPVIQGND